MSDRECIAFIVLLIWWTAVIAELAYRNGLRNAAYKEIRHE